MRIAKTFGLSAVKEETMHKGFDSRLDQAWWALRIGLGVGPFLAGLDKYFNLLANWPAYMSPLALKIMPFTAQTFMHIVGVIEMIVGLAILTKWTRLRVAACYRHQSGLDRYVL